MVTLAAVVSVMAGAPEGYVVRFGSLAEVSRFHAWLSRNYGEPAKGKGQEAWFYQGAWFFYSIQPLDTPPGSARYEERFLRRTPSFPWTLTLVEVERLVAEWAAQPGLKERRAPLRIDHAGLPGTR
jgi:hypothetical protein